MDGAPGDSLDSSRRQELGGFFREELKPYPGRLKATFVRTAGTILGLWVGLALDLPEISAVLALAFFASSVDREECKKIALGVPPAVLVILLLLTLFLNIFGTTPLVRTVAFIVIIFSSLYLLQAAQAGAIFLLAAIFGKLFLGLWDNNYPAELIQRLQLFVVEDIAVAGLCAFFVCSIFGNPGRNPATEFRNELACQFDLLSRFFTGLPGLSESEEEKFRGEALSAPDKLLPLLDKARDKNAAVRSRYMEFGALVRLAVLLLHQSVSWNIYTSEDEAGNEELWKWIGIRCKAIAQAVRSGNPLPHAQNTPPVTRNTLAAAMVSTIILAEDVLAGRISLAEDQKQESPKGFFRPDAFSNTAYLTNAFRATVAAFACYCLIAGANYSGISTAVTTCLITALTTVEQTRQKQSLRIFGAALGGILGLLVIVFILPGGTGLTGLSVVTAIVTMLGAWIYAGSPKLSYAGVQLVLCFYLGLFTENSTPTSLTGLRDRVVGILIGNIAMWLFYDRIQPVWTADVSRNGFADELLAVGKLAQIRAEPPDNQKARRSLLHARKTFLNASSGLRDMGNSYNFEFNFYSKLQRKKAPHIRCTEVQLQRLFSLEFAAIETVLLHLPQIQTGASNQRISDSLLTLASLVRRGGAVRTTVSKLPENNPSPDELLLERVNKELLRLFSSGRERPVRGKIQHEAT